jgi:hypothetical protein
MPLIGSGLFARYASEKHKQTREIVTQATDWQQQLLLCQQREKQHLFKSTQDIWRKSRRIKKPPTLPVGAGGERGENEKV